MRQICNASGFDGDLTGFLNSLFPPSPKQFRVVDLFIVGDGAWEGGLAHVLVFDDIPVPNLDRDGFRRIPTEE